MSVAKIIEVSSKSNKSFEDAMSKGIKTAAKSVKNIKSAWVKEQKVMVDGDKISEYRVVLKISFLVK